MDCCKLLCGSALERGPFCSDFSFYGVFRERQGGLEAVDWGFTNTRIQHVRTGSLALVFELVLLFVLGSSLNQAEVTGRRELS